MIPDSATASVGADKRPTLRKEMTPIAIGYVGNLFPTYVDMGHVPSLVMKIDFTLTLIALADQMLVGHGLGVAFLTAMGKLNLQGKPAALTLSRGILLLGNGPRFRFYIAVIPRR